MRRVKARSIDQTHGFMWSLRALNSCVGLPTQKPTRVIAVGAAGLPVDLPSQSLAYDRQARPHWAHELSPAPPAGLFSSAQIAHEEPPPPHRVELELLRCCRLRALLVHGIDVAEELALGAPGLSPGIPACADCDID
jgi:hypothetical protein